MDAVRCFVDNQVKTWDKHLGLLAGAMRSAVNRHTGYTPNKLMLGREVNNPATLRFTPPPGEGLQNGGEGDSDAYVAGLERTLQVAHEVAREKLRAAQKSMKRDYDLHMRSREYKVGDLVYWRRNAGKKVQSIWLGPGIVDQVKSDTVYAIRTRRDIKIMHHDKLRPCISRKLPKWIRDYQARSSDRGVPDSQPPIVDLPTPPPATKANKAQNGRDCSAPYLGTRSRTGALNPRQNAERDSVAAKGRNRPAKRGQYKYCLCKSTRPAGLMVQCDTCKDWFHPKCVGETEEHVKNVPTYSCPDCILVV